MKASIVLALRIESPVIRHVKHVIVTEITHAYHAMTMLQWSTIDEVVILDMLWLPQTHRTESHVTQDVLNVLEPLQLNEPRVLLGLILSYRTGMSESPSAQWAISTMEASVRDVTVLEQNARHQLNARHDQQIASLEMELQTIAV